MKLTTTTAPVTTPFALDPTLPWLLTDPKMQEPEAFHYMETLTLADTPWEPMAQYFPAGAKLAMRRVTSLDQLTEGAAYFYKHSYYEPSQSKVLTRSYLGRYAGLTYPESKSTPKRWKQGEAHINLECDVMDCNLLSYMYREDGTMTVFADTDGDAHKIYQITHYINLPASLLGQLGPSAIKQSGVSLRQACYLKQEQEIHGEAVELTAKASGWPGPSNWRVVMPFDSLRDFLLVQDSLKTITAGQAKKCKTGSLTITMRSYTQRAGLKYLNVEHFKLEDACELLDWMRHHSAVQEFTLNAAVVRQGIGFTAEAIRAQRDADEAAEKAAAAAAKAADKQYPTAVLEVRQDEYASVKELALAA